MNISKLKTSKYLTKDDCGKGILLTIAGIEEHNVAMQGEPAENKFCLVFEEDVKPMILNSVNGQLIAKFLHSEETDTWIGKQIVAYNDPNVMMAGRVTGGIRCRAPKAKPAAPAAAAPAQQPTRAYSPPPVQSEAQPLEEAEDDVPF